MASPPAPVLALPQTLLHEQAADCLGQLTAGLQALRGAKADLSQPWVIDASALREFDSSALAVLLACRRTAQDMGATVRVTALPPALRELALVYGVLDLLGS